jgi:hypothetical protein
MKMARKILRNFNLTVDGVSMQGVVESFTPPKVSVKAEEVRLGGQDAPHDLDMGMEKLDVMFTLVGYNEDTIKLVGLRLASYKSLVFRGALQDENGDTVTQLKYTCYGKGFEVDPGEHKVGETNRLTFRFNLLRFREEHDSRIVHEIDLPNMIRVIGGIDQNEAIRNAIGI